MVPYVVQEEVRPSFVVEKQSLSARKGVEKLHHRCLRL